jgi:hypothetical protein
MGHTASFSGVQPESSRRLDASDADATRVFVENPELLPHPLGWTGLDGWTRELSGGDDRGTTDR